MKKPFIFTFISAFLSLCVPFQNAQATTTERVFRFANSRDPQSLDPAFLDARPETTIGRELFEGLVSYDPQTGKPLPGVAQNWTVSSDGRTYTFQLRTNALWSDGHPVLASDFIYAWKRLIEPSTAAYFPKLFTEYVEGAKEYAKQREHGTGDFSTVGISAPNEHTITIRLKHATPFYLEVVGMASYYPIPQHRVEKNNQAWAAPKNIVGNGPFVLESLRRKDNVVLRKNTKYWDAKNVNIDKVIIYPIEDDKSALNMYKAGELDWIGAVPTILLPKLRKTTELHSAAILGTRYIRINTTKPELTNPKVRRAMSMALDRKILVERVLREMQQPAYSFVPAGLSNYSANAQITENIAEARKLMTEAGYPNGKGMPEISLLFQPNSQSSLVAIAISKMLGDALGVKVGQLRAEKGIFYDKLDSMSYDLALSNFSADFNDAESFLGKFASENVSENLTGFKNAEYDQFLKQASAFVNPKDRNRSLAAAEKILVIDQAAIIPLYHGVNIEMWKSYVSGLYMNPLGFHSLKNVTLLK